MKKIVHSALSLCLVLFVVCAVFPMTAFASYSYDADKALNYARDNWNKNSEQQCAEFVSRCVIAGGLPISVQYGTGPCYRAIGNTIGVYLGNEKDKSTYNGNNLESLATLVLDSKGYATQSANGNILSAGDVVIQWCFTEHISPHILICGGYDLNGNATFYAHNSGLNNKTYNLAKNSQHKSTCNIGAKVIHFGSNNSAPPPAATCVHTYDKMGICTSCKEPYAYNAVNCSFACTVINAAAAKAAPYGAYDTIRTIPTGSTVSIVTSTVNHYGNMWYKTAQGDWICSDRCEKATEKPVLTIAGKTIPGTLLTGDNFGIRGTISTNCGRITSVYGAILNSNGSEVQGKTYTPNSSSYDLRKSINNDLIFDKLTAGTYTYKVTATAVNGNQTTNTTLINVTFKVEGSTVSCSHRYNSKGICTVCGTAYPYVEKGVNFLVKTTDYAYVQSKPYGDNSYYVRTMSAGTSVSVSATAVNHYDITWYKLNDGNWICSDRCETVSETAKKPTLSLSGQTTPDVLNEGDNFGIRGTIIADCGNITQVYGAILNSSNSVVQSKTYYPNTASHNLKTSINNDLIFDKLSAGTYIYKVTATAVNGSQTSTSTLINCIFTVKGSSATAAIAVPAAPTNLCATAFGSESATISWTGNSGATSYEVQYYSPSAGTWKYDSDYESGTSYVSTGLGLYDSYQYRVRAVNSSGNSAWVNITYTKAASVTEQKPTLTISGVKTPNEVSLKVGNNFGIRGIISTNCGMITEVYGAITNIDGSVVQSTRYYPNASSHDLRYSINNDLIFNNLSAGNYVYTVTANAANGGQSTSSILISCSFTVSAA